MEEVKQEQVQEEVVEVVEEKKKGFSKKKLLPIVGVIALGVGAVVVRALTKGKNGNEESQNQFGDEPTVTLEPVTDYTDVEYTE